MKLINPFKKENIVITILLFALAINSFFVGYYIGTDLKETNTHDSTIILTLVDVKSIEDLWFLTISVKLLYTEGVDYRVQVRFYNDDLSIYTLNATMLRIELIITDIYYYFKIVDWFYTYAKFDLNATSSFTLSNLTFWHLQYVDVESGGEES